ncbi:MAG TPA: aldo/keto reductase [Chloroflexota bacterium]
MSALSLGGGGIGGTWGPRTRQESVATVREAVDAGITLIDVAPAYGNGEAEMVIGEAFGGRLPPHVRVVSKCALFARWSTVRQRLIETPLTPDLLAAMVERSVSESLARLNLERLDVLLLHDPIVLTNDDPGEPGIERGLVGEYVRPIFEGLVARGRVGAWGLSGTGTASAVLEVLGEDPPPSVVQIEANVLRSRFATGSSERTPATPELIAAANRRGVGVMGIRPTQSGALTDAFDRPVNAAAALDFRQAEPFRGVARGLGVPPARLAHRYALSIPGVSTVTLGVKNRDELREALAAEAEGPLDPSLVARIDAAVAPPSQLTSG